jgi:hypothetical protein
MNPVALSIRSRTGATETAFDAGMDAAGCGVVDVLAGGELGVVSFIQTVR